MVLILEGNGNDKEFDEGIPNGTYHVIGKFTIGDNGIEKINNSVWRIIK